MRRTRPVAGLALHAGERGSVACAVATGVQVAGAVAAYAVRTRAGNRVLEGRPSGRVLARAPDGCSGGMARRAQDLPHVAVLTAIHPDERRQRARERMHNRPTTRGIGHDTRGLHRSRVKRAVRIRLQRPGHDHRRSASPQQHDQQLQNSYATRVWNVK